MSTATEAAVYAEAERILSEPRAWVKGGHTVYLNATETAHCLIGALDQARLSLEVCQPHSACDYPVLYEAVQRRTGREELVSFNDAPETKLEDVLSLLREARATLEGRVP